MEKPWVSLDWDGQRIYLPEYVKLFRKIERRFCDFLEQINFQECLFTKLPTIQQSLKLKEAIPRLSNEWSKEIVNAQNSSDNLLYPCSYTLSHWQCEPFYFYLQKEKPYTDIKFYDKSGWSYRIEPDINDFRLFEFQRIEVVWFAEKKSAEIIQQDIIQGLKEIFESINMQVRIDKKREEEKQSKEKSVIDIVTKITNVGTVELVGSHLHGRLFIEALNMEVDKGFYTGCCGIGLSRIVNALIIGGYDC